MTDDIVAALKTVYDPEIPADIYELGLIYKVDIADDRSVKVDMTLTTPNCPSAAELPLMVENAVASVPGVEQRQVQHRLGSAVGPEPHVGRGAARAQHVVSCGSPATPYIDVSKCLVFLSYSRFANSASTTSKARRRWQWPRPGRDPR